MKSSEKKVMEKNRVELLYTQDKIAQRIKELGARITRDYTEKDPIILGVLKGCVIFLADLVRHIDIPVELEFISASSYNGEMVPEEEVTMTGWPNVSVTGRHVILVEGVVDSGHTAKAIIDTLKLKEPASVEVVTLLDKPTCRKVDIEIKYVGFDAGDNFVIGYGLDAAQRYRNLPFIGKVIQR